MMSASSQSPACVLHRYDDITCCLQAYNLVNKGKAVLLDVREARYYDRQHAEGAVNVGLFREVQGRSTLENIKRIAMAGLAMTATGGQLMHCMHTQPVECAFG